jgi:hypothetical protein
MNIDSILKTDMKLKILDGEEKIKKMNSEILLLKKKVEDLEEVIKKKEENDEKIYVYEVDEKVYVPFGGAQISTFEKTSKKGIFQLHNKNSGFYYYYFIYFIFFFFLGFNVNGIEVREMGIYLMVVVYCSRESKGIIFWSVNGGPKQKRMIVYFLIVTYFKKKDEYVGNNSWEDCTLSFTYNVTLNKGNNTIVFYGGFFFFFFCYNIYIIYVYLFIF